MAGRECRAVADPLPRRGGQQHGQGVEPPSVPRAEPHEPLPRVVLGVQGDAGVPEVLHDLVELVATDGGLVFLAAEVVPQVLHRVRSGQVEHLGLFVRTVLHHRQHERRGVENRAQGGHPRRVVVRGTEEGQERIGE